MHYFSAVVPPLSVCPVYVGEYWRGHHQLRFVYTMITADDVALRKRAWTNALIALIFTSLGGGGRWLSSDACGSQLLFQ
ncbi:hypothetical protein BG74_06485 [Sodalis-like endosymbiont of Proechinophthirus fluctus]|nr:hypothetical protein BG74_06485 [Sodalis-like endosymbiont of Proechinophthirus fluctus]